MPETFYCRGDDVLAVGRDQLPTDKDGRVLPGFHTYLKPRAQWEAEHADDN